MRRGFLISPGYTVSLLSPATASVSRLLSSCRGIRTVLTSLMTGLKQSLWNQPRARRESERARNCSVYCARPLLRPPSLLLLQQQGARCCNCITVENDRGTKHLGEIVSPDLPNERHCDFVNHRRAEATGVPSSTTVRREIPAANWRLTIIRESSDIVGNYFAVERNV